MTFPTGLLRVFGGPRSWAAACVLAGLVAVGCSPESGPGPGQATPGPCKARKSGEAAYVVCAFDPGLADVRIALDDGSGGRWSEFEPLLADLAARGIEPQFAMNAGMFHPDLSPVGLLVSDMRVLAPVEVGKGEGNFYLKPNGVFYVDEDGYPAIAETGAFLDSGAVALQATQSGPLLLAKGVVHPELDPASESRFRRNGVGVAEGGEQAYFVIADTPVTLHEFALFFRDELKTPDALYLDGAISRLCAPHLNRCDAGDPMGPIVVVTKLPAPGTTETPPGTDKDSTR